MALPREKPKVRASKNGSGARKRRRRSAESGWERFFNFNSPLLPDSLRWVLLIGGAAMILAAGIGWPSSIRSTQTLLGTGGGALVIFAFFGVRRTLAGLAKVLEKLDEFRGR